MEEQSYAKHVKYVPGYLAIFVLIVLSTIGSLVNLWKSFGDHQGLHSASLITALSVAVLFLFFFARRFALGVQDRAIRAEENLRHFALAGKRLDPRLTIQQIVGLRFASDAEFVELARKAADEAMPLDTIKKSVKNWRADHDRI